MGMERPHLPLPCQGRVCYASKQLAQGPGDFEDPSESAWIEAAFLHRHDDDYFLFVNWFGCCNGIDSSYEIHMGRSSSRTGPFLDRRGVAMTDGGEACMACSTTPNHPGGSLVLTASGRFIGPGHAAVFPEHGREWFSFHFYDGERDGVPWLEVGSARNRAY